MKLSDICKIKSDMVVKGITADSREVEQGFIFGSLNDPRR